MKSVELKRHALNLVRLSKKFLLEDGDLDPTAFILTADDQLLRPIELNDESHTSDSSKRIADEARRKNALAIITIFLARSKDVSKEEFDEEAHSYEDTEDSSSDRCILVTLSGPGITNWATALPFRTVKRKIVFSKRVEYKKGVDLDCFPVGRIRSEAQPQQ